MITCTKYGRFVTLPYRAWYEIRKRVLFLVAPTIYVDSFGAMLEHPLPLSQRNASTLVSDLVLVALTLYLYYHLLLIELFSFIAGKQSSTRYFIIRSTHIFSVA